MSTGTSKDQALEHFHEDFEALKREIAKVVVGQTEAIEHVLTAAIAGGHVLVEGVPGLGKTLLIQTLASVLQVGYNRIQFTPDVMPSDLLGTYIVMETAQGRRMFEFQKGPIFSNFILADQINRGLPKTQSALLQAMEGDAITMATEVFHLPEPFFVMGTQNPLDTEGTYPLPEPEIDRFFFKLVPPPPSLEELDAILERTTEGLPDEVRAIVDGKRLLEMREMARDVVLDPQLRRWAATVVAATHPDFAKAPEAVKRYARYGASPRGARSLGVGGQGARAAAAGRNAVSKDDLCSVVVPALRHRVQLNFEGQAENIGTDA